MKLPLAPIGIAAGVGVAAYVAGQQISKSIPFFQTNWYAFPGALIAGGLFVATKSMPVGLGMAAAGGALGYFQYAAATGQTTAGTASTTSTTQPSALPASTSTASTTPATNGSSQSTATQLAQTAANAATGAANSTGTSPGGTGNSTGSSTDTGAGSSVSDGSTGTSAAGSSGYSAGALMHGPPMASHIPRWNRSPNVGHVQDYNRSRGAGALMHGPAMASHLAPWRRGGAGHYSDGDAAGLTSD